MVIFGIDAHTSYQAGLDVEQVAREGYQFMIIKATQGATGYTAPAAFDGWIRRGRAAGMVCGAYHWLTDADPIGQVEHYLDRLAAVGGPQGLLCAVDVEDVKHPPTYAGLRRFADRFADRTGGHPLLVYTGAWWWSPRGWNGAAVSPHLWASRYVVGSGYGSALYAKVPASWWYPGYGGWPEVTMLQYSSSGRVAGRSVDVNAYRGTLPQLRALTVPGVATTSPSAEKGPTMIFVQVKDKPSIVATDWCRWCDQSISYDRVMAMHATGVPIVEIDDDQMARILALPSPQVLASSGAATVQMDAALLSQLAEQVVSALSPALVPVAGLLQHLTEIGDALGDAGDALAALNDDSES